MYTTSSAYRDSLDAGYLNTEIHGTITSTTGAVTSFSDADIIPGSLTIDNKSVNSNEFNYGGVYVGELAMSLMKSIDRYSLYGAEVTLTYTQTTYEGVTQDIPLGIFYVYEASRNRKTISIRAYDAMTKLDVPVDETITGYMPEVLEYIADKCEIELAQTAEEIEGFLNSEWYLTVDPELTATYREAVSQVGILSGQFVTIDREGKLAFRPLQTTTVVDSISAKRRTDAKIEDFTTYFCSVKARFFNEQNYYPYTAVDETVVQGLELDLGDIGIFRGEEASKQQIMDNLLEYTVQISYVPTEVSMISDPSLDVGDCVELENVNGTTHSVKTLLHSISWKYHGEQKTTAYGMDPMLAGVVSKEEKLLSQIESQMAAKNIVIKTYTNSRRLNINDSREQEIVLLNFATVEQTTVLFICSVPFESDRDGTVTVHTYLDGVLDETATAKQYVEKGHHVLTVSNYLPMRANGRATLRLCMITEYTESPIRDHDSKIVSILDYIETGTYPEPVYDTTAPTITVLRSTIKAMLFAQGLAGAGQWDGTINVVEEFNPVSFDLAGVLGISIGEINENINVRHVSVARINKSMELSPIDVKIGIGEVEIGEFMEEIETYTEEIPHGEAFDYMSAVIVGDNQFTLGTISTNVDISSES